MGKPHHADQESNSPTQGGLLPAQYFDPVLHQFISAEELWERNAKYTNQCLADSQRRVDDLMDLHESAQRALHDLSQKERASLRALEDATLNAIASLQARKEALQRRVVSECETQRNVLEQLLGRVSSSMTRLRSQTSIIMSKDASDSSHAAPSAPKHPVTAATKFKALKQCEETLKNTAFFPIDEMYHYDVSAKPISAESILTLSKKRTTVLITTSLTRQQKERITEVPLSGAVGGGGAGTFPVGIIHNIATNGGADAFKNPQHEDWIRLSCNIPIEVGTLQSLVYNRTTWSDVPKRDAHHRTSSSSTAAGAAIGVRTKNVPGGRIIIDFGETRRVHVTAYILQHGNAKVNKALRNWNLEGSDDGVHWTILDQREDSNALCENFNEAVLLVGQRGAAGGGLKRGKLSSHAGAAAGGACRFLSIVSTGPNASGDRNFHIELGRMEFFGTLISLQSS